MHDPERVRLRLRLGVGGGAALDGIRAQAQGFLVLVTQGLGMLIGAQIAPWLRGRNTPVEAGELYAKSGDLMKQAGAMTDESLAKPLIDQANALSQGIKQAGVDLEAIVFPGGYDDRVTGLPGYEGAYLGTEFKPLEVGSPGLTKYTDAMEAAGFDLLPGEHAIVPVMFPDAHDAVAIALTLGAPAHRHRRP